MVQMYHFTVLQVLLGLTGLKSRPEEHWQGRSPPWTLKRRLFGHLSQLVKAAYAPWLLVPFLHLQTTSDLSDPLSIITVRKCSLIWRTNE